LQEPCNAKTESNLIESDSEYSTIQPTHTVSDTELTKSNDLYACSAHFSLSANALNTPRYAQLSNRTEEMTIASQSSSDTPYSDEEQQQESDNRCKKPDL